MSAQMKSKFISIFDQHDQNPLVDEVKETLSSMLHQFEHEQTAKLHHGLECLAAGIASVLSSVTRNFHGGVNNTKFEGIRTSPNMVHADIHMEGVDVKGLNLKGCCDEHCVRDDCPAGPAGFYPTVVCDDGDCNLEETQKLPNSGSESTPGQCDDLPTQKLPSSTESIRAGDCDQEETQKLYNSGSEETPGQCDNQPTQKLSSSSESIQEGDCDQEETQKLLNSRSEATPVHWDDQKTQKISTSLDLSTNNKRKRTSSSQDYDRTRNADGYNSIAYEQSHKLKRDNNGMKDDYLFFTESSQNQAITGENDRISKYFKFPYSPKVMDLFNWVPSFDLGIDDDDVHIIRSQSDTIFLPEGVSKSKLNNVSHSVHGVTRDSYVKEDIRILNIDIDNDVQVMNNAQKHNQGGVIVIDNIKSQVPTENTPLANNVSSMNAINLVPQGTMFSSTTPQKTVNVLQPLDVNVVNSRGSGGAGSSTCKMPAYGKRRQVRGSRYTGHPYTSPINRFVVSSEDMAYYQAVISLSKGKHGSSKAISVKPDGKTYVTYSCLGYSLRPEGKIDNFLVNCFCRLLFQENHPTKSKKHFFFNSVGQQFLKAESEFSFANVKHEFGIAHKVRSLQSCELILFPILKEDHWFLFVVDIKDQKFVFLDSAVGGRSYDDTTMMNLIGNFTSAFFATAKRTSVNPLDFDIDQLSPHRQKWKKDSGVFVMKYMDIWDPRVALEARFTIDDMPKIRIHLLNRMLRSDQNMADLSHIHSIVGKGDFRHAGHQI